MTQIFVSRDVSDTKKSDIFNQKKAKLITALSDSPLCTGIEVSPEESLPLKIFGGTLMVLPIPTCLIFVYRRISSIVSRRWPIFLLLQSLFL